MAALEPLLHFKDIFLKRSSLAARRDLHVRCDFNFSAMQTRRRRQITRSAERQISSGWLYVFICKSALISVESHALLPRAFPVVLALIGITPHRYFFLSKIDSHKIKFTKHREFPCSYDRKGRHIITVASEDCFYPPRILFCKNMLRKMTLQARDVNSHNDRTEELISNLLLNPHFIKLKVICYKIFQ